MGKRYAIALLALGCSALVIPAITHYLGGRSGSLVRMQDIEDLGIVPRGTVLERKVKITNVSSRKLHLGLGHATCGCTVAGLDREVLSPGEYATGTLTVRTAGKLAVQEGAPLTIQSMMDGTNGSAEIHAIGITASVDQSHGLFPASLVVPRARIGGGAMAAPFEIRFSNQTDAPMVKVTPALSFARIELDSPEATAEGSLVRGRLIVDPNSGQAPSSEFTADLDVEFANPKLRRLSAQIVGAIGAEIESHPGVIVWNSSERDAPRTIRLDAVDATLLKIESITCDSPTLLRWEILDQSTSNAGVRLFCAMQEKAHSVTHSVLHLQVRDIARPRTLKLDVPIIIF